MYGPIFRHHTQTKKYINVYKKPDSGRRKDKKIYFSQFCMSTVGIVCSFITVYSVSHIVAGCISPDRVLCCQSNTAHRNDNQDGHLKITHSHNIVTQPPHPEEKEAKKKEVSTCCCFTVLVPSHTPAVLKCYIQLVPVRTHRYHEIGF